MYLTYISSIRTMHIIRISTSVRVEVVFHFGILITFIFLIFDTKKHSFKCRSNLSLDDSHDINGITVLCDIVTLNSFGLLEISCNFLFMIL